MPQVLWAQFSAGRGEGTDQSASIQLDLTGVPGGIRALYAGGTDDGFASEGGFGSFTNQEVFALYSGGAGGGYHFSSGSATLDGVTLTPLYAGGSGDGFSFLQQSQTLDGFELISIYGGGAGDGYNQLLASARNWRQVLTSSGLRIQSRGNRLRFYW